jgi:hypothetical protein
MIEGAKVLKTPLREFKELEVDETEVETEEAISGANKLFPLRPKTGELIELRFIGYPE